jgi:hypothetical protein
MKNRAQTGPLKDLIMNEDEIRNFVFEGCSPEVSSLWMQFASGQLCILNANWPHYRERPFKAESWQTYQRRAKKRTALPKVDEMKCFCGRHFAFSISPDAVYSACAHCGVKVTSSKWDVTNTVRLSDVEHQRTQETSDNPSGPML